MARKLQGVTQGERGATQRADRRMVRQSAGKDTKREKEGYEQRERENGERNRGGPRRRDRGGEHSRKTEEESQDRERV